ncbi:serine hydrolase domain-containing protein [Caulobacter sp. 17J65-9]|uniref:serine hydrolase domain-containing protein n=1 Tax=Caulobacter sp. 17J65-9 TaxID=2709382 RepID=UPI0013C8D8E4|nr:serine hydrolase domain-containing protein [Caulobacter sp. 17J65-9]NEX91398.1 beta-lactamase family protein [Caulobacter sp. 17J65-9]
MILRQMMFAAALACAVWPSTGAAADRDRFGRDLDAFVTRALERTEAVPGLAIAVVDGQGTVKTAGYGLADVEARTPATARTPFYIASSTKSFTALAVAAMAERAELDLDAPLSRWAPGSRIAPEFADKVSLSDLLSHRSGLQNDALAFRLAYSGDWSDKGLWALTGETRANADAPYGTFSYTNTGYNLATVLLQHRFHRDWSALVENEVLDPLGMTHTTADVERVRRTSGVAWGYLGLRAGEPQRAYLQKSDATMHSAGGLVSTADDMALWLEAQVNDGVVHGRRVFPAGLIASTHVPRAEQNTTFGAYTRTGYGLGWQVGRYRDDLLIHHFGNFAGSRAHVSLMPERRLGVAVMVNEDAVAGELADLVANYVYDWFAGRPDLEAVYDAELTRLAERRDARRKALAQGREARLQRPRQLSLPDAAYAGTYVSPAMGTMKVRATPDGLELSIGLQHALAEPFTAPESVRVELTPLRGEPVVFGLADGKPKTLTYAGYTFTRRP